MLPLIGFSKPLKVIANGITSEAFMPHIINGFQRTYGVFTIFEKKNNVNLVINAINKDRKNSVGLGDRIAFRQNSEKGTWSMQIAWSALVFIVNKKNPIRNITIKQAQQILTGKIRNWKMVGGMDKPIHIYRRKGLDSGIGFTTRALLFGKIKQKFYKETFKRENSFEIRKSVANDENGIAIDDFIIAKKKVNIKVLTLNGRKATSNNILHKKYPLARQLYIYTKGRPYGNVIKFITYVRSREGQRVIRNLGLIGFKQRNGRKHFNKLLDMVIEQ